MPVRGGLCTGPSSALPDGHRDTTRIYRSKVPHTSRSRTHNLDCGSLRSAYKFPSSLLEILGLGWPFSFSPVCPSGLQSFDEAMMREWRCSSNGTKLTHINGTVLSTNSVACQA